MSGSSQRYIRRLCTQFAGTRFPRIGSLKDNIQFFQGPLACLDVEEVNKDKLKKVPEDEEDVEPVTNLRPVSQHPTSTLTPLASLHCLKPLARQRC